MLKITNNSLTRFGTGCLATVDVKGLTRRKLFHRPKPSSTRSWALKSCHQDSKRCWNHSY